MTHHNKEQLYDNEIAPKLRQLAERCQELDMPLFAAVDYGTGEEALGCTVCPHKNSGIQWKLISFAAGCKGNLDLLIRQIVRHAEKHGHSSAYIHLLQSVINQNKSETT